MIAVASVAATDTGGSLGIISWADCKSTGASLDTPMLDGGKGDSATTGGASMGGCAVGTCTTVVARSASAANGGVTVTGGATTTGGLSTPESGSADAGDSAGTEKPLMGWSAAAPERWLRTLDTEPLCRPGYRAPSSCGLRGTSHETAWRGSTFLNASDFGGTPRGATFSLSCRAEAVNPASETTAYFTR